MSKEGSRSWEWQLARFAANRLADGVARLAVLAGSIGLDRAPSMSIIVKRAPRRATPARPSPETQLPDRYAYLQEDFAGMLIAV